MFEITRAVSSDAPAIAAVAEAVRFAGGGAASASSTGFLVHVQSASVYQRRLEASDLFFVARDGERLIGFLGAYRRTAIAGLRDTMSHEDELVDLVLQDDAADSVLVDQIAVLPDYAGQGVAQALLDRLRNAAPQARCYAAIAHAPVRNLRSLAFFTRKNGWCQLCESREGSLVWGLYTSEPCSRNQR